MEEGIKMYKEQLEKEYLNKEITLKEFWEAFFSGVSFKEFIKENKINEKEEIGDEKVINLEYKGEKYKVILYVEELRLEDLKDCICKIENIKEI